MQQLHLQLHRTSLSYDSQDLQLFYVSQTNNTTIIPTITSISMPCWALKPLAKR